MLLWFVFGVSAIVPRVSKMFVFFSQFFGAFGGWFILVSLGLEGLGVLFFLCLLFFFVLLLFLFLSALFVFCCWIVLDVGSCFVVFFLLVLLFLLFLLFGFCFFWRV